MNIKIANYLNHIKIFFFNSMQIFLNYINFFYFFFNTYIKFCFSI